MQPNPRPALLAEVKAIGGHTAVVSEVRALASEAGGSGVALKHVEAPADRSAPMIDGASVGQVRAQAVAARGVTQWRCGLRLSQRKRS